MTGIDFRQYNRWPEELEKQVIEYWEKGYSASIIGGLMGKTRNAIIGKVQRLGLAAREPRRMPLLKKPPASLPRRDRNGKGRLQTNFNFSLGRQKKEKPIMLKPVVPLTEIVPLNGEGVTILDLRKEHCHAVVKEQGRARGDCDLALYCGHPVMEGESYCVDHYCAFYQPPRPRSARPSVPYFRK